MARTLCSFVQGKWVPSSRASADILSAIDGSLVARLAASEVDFEGAARFARNTGGSALRKMTFHQRADLLKALAAYLNDNRKPLYELSFHTGATRRDSVIDIDGGIGTLFAYASRGRREFPSETFIVEGSAERLSKRGTFSGLHVLTPLQGFALHINAYNFPCWGMLEKLAPAILAGVPVITKPATATAFLAEAVIQLIVKSGILPPGALQFIAGSTGDLLDHLTGQDTVGFTGSAATSNLLKAHKVINDRAVRFVAERDSLNAAILGPDATPGTPEYQLFIQEIINELTVKAGQKCTAIRRIIVPNSVQSDVIASLKDGFTRIRIGDPRSAGVTMGPLVSLAQRESVLAAVNSLMTEADLVAGNPDHVTVQGADSKNGAFISPLLLRAKAPTRARAIHEVEAFGPVGTVLGYDNLDEAIALTAKGEGSLVASLYTYDDRVAEELLFGTAPYHGRLLVLDRDCATESTGHGSPLPGLVHGGPGRAGGGEELGGARGVMHYLQRTALQGAPERLTALTKQWIAGTPPVIASAHPFRSNFEELVIGQTVLTDSRTISLSDIEEFANFTGDTFYAHMDENAAKANPFFQGRVAHGYLILSFAAGLFVDPAPGPLLANYGLDNLRFLKPVHPGDSIRVRLTVKEKQAAKSPEYGEVRWDVSVSNQRDEIVAQYELLTMSARVPSKAAP